MPPFWCVERGHPDAANMEMKDIDINSFVTVLAPNKGTAEVRHAREKVVKVTIPIMTNPKFIKEGTNLIVERDVAVVKDKVPKKKTAWDLAQEEVKKAAMSSSPKK